MHLAAQPTCPNCGTELDGPVCAFCDESLGSQPTADDEMRALEAYHRELDTADKQQMYELLRDGYIPADPKVLVEAGLRTIPLLSHQDLTGKASQLAEKRLASIIGELELCEESPEIAAALTKFRKLLRGHQRFMLATGLGGVAFLIIIGVLVWYFVFR